MSLDETIIRIGDLKVESGKVSFFVPPPGLAVGRGAFCALVGSSGSGKSVLMSILTGHLLQPWMNGGARIACGVFEILGASIGQEDLCSAHRLRKRFRDLPTVYMPQKLPEDKSSKRSTLSEMADVAEAIAPQCGLGFLKRKITEYFSEHGLQTTLAQPLCSLSGGQRKRVEVLARVVGAVERSAENGDSPDIVFLLDEPMTGLDVRNQREYFLLLKNVQTQIKKVRLTFIITTHAAGLLKENEIFSTVIFVQNRQDGERKESASRELELAFCGSGEEFLKREDLFKKIG